MAKGRPASPDLDDERQLGVPVGETPDPVETPSIPRTRGIGGGSPGGGRPGDWYDDEDVSDPKRPR